jgi:hypothetical protein
MCDFKAFQLIMMYIRLIYYIRRVFDNSYTFSSLSEDLELIYFWHIYIYIYLTKMFNLFHIIRFASENTDIINIIRFR